jgi:hypothetical protein
MLNFKETFEQIKKNRPIQECLNTIPPTAFHETIWFIYYMFFAIHNPKMEEYIQKKLNIVATTDQAHRDIIKNMITRRHYTSKIVFQLYTHAYTNNGSVTYIYPKDKDAISKQMIKSYQLNRLKTTAVLLRRAAAASAAASAVITFIDHVITTAPTIPSASTGTSVLNKINNHISYERKDIILLALMCHMKLKEEDINMKNIFIAATEDDDKMSTAAIEPERSSPSPYDEKYKYLYT